MLILFTPARGEAILVADFSAISTASILRLKRAESEA